MLKIAASVLGGALTVGGAGYSYVTTVQAESAAVKAENAHLKMENDTKTQRLASMDRTVDDIIRQLQMLRTAEKGQ